MTKELFKKILVELEDLGEHDLDGFECTIDDINYRFDCEKPEWRDDGKYHYSEESGQLVKTDNNYRILERFKYGVSRNLQRSGSYSSGYHYSYDEFEPYEIVKVVVPKKLKLIPRHIITQHKIVKYEKENTNEVFYD